jgi:hypothetical protein
MAQEEGHIEARPGDESASRGGCLNFGWGCLPVLVGFVVMLPAAWWMG